MSIFKAIAAMAENRVIGYQGKLPWHLPEEYRWFKHMTMGGTLIMGRKTYESIGRPLPGRKTVVLTKNDVSIPGVEICRNLSQLPSDNSWSGDKTDICWVCGGTQIYEQLLPKCHFLYLTRVKKRIAGDAHFPEFEKLFNFEYVLHENHAFRVERWINPKQQWKDYSNEREAWPFNT